MTEQDLLNLKMRIDSAKEESAILKGRKDALLEQMQENFGVKNLPQAKKKLQEMQNEIEEQGEAIELAFEELQNKLDNESNSGTQK